MTWTYFALNLKGEWRNIRCATGPRQKLRYDGLGMYDEKHFVDDGTLWLVCSLILENKLLKPSVISPLSDIFELFIMKVWVYEDVSLILPMACFKSDQHFLEFLLFSSSAVLKYDCFVFRFNLLNTIRWSL